jgi:hypothetical protein
MAGFDQWRGAKINVAGVGKYAYGRNQGRTDQANGDNL